MVDIPEEYIDEIKKNDKRGFQLANHFANGNELILRTLLFNFVDINPRIAKHIPFDYVWNEDILLLLANKKEETILLTIFALYDYLKDLPGEEYVMLKTRIVFSEEFCILLLALSNEFLEYIPEEYKTAIVLVKARLLKVKRNAVERRRHILRIF
jgi:hypothetical protein